MMWRQFPNRSFQYLFPLLKEKQNKYSSHFLKLRRQPYKTTSVNLKPMSAVQSYCESINTFLKNSVHSVRNFEKNHVQGHIHLVTGNEASDADSMISALVYSFYLASKNKDPSHIYAPLMPIPRSEFHLRCETMALFKKLGIDAQHLLFDDEVSLQKLHNHQCLRMILTDHNKLCKARAAFESAVEEILDHHFDEKCYHWVEGVKRKVEFDPTDGSGKPLLGSCCTLVGELIPNESMDPVLATLLYAVILLDTVNLQPSANKVTPRDVAMANRLCKSSMIPQDELFNWLQGERYNSKYWGAFTQEECLKYDFKEFSFPNQNEEFFGCSATLISEAEFLAKSPNAEKVMEEFSKQKNLTFLLVLATVVSKDHRERQILLYCRDSETMESIAKLIENGKELETKPLGIPATQNYKCWLQVNPALSRKQIVPIVYNLLR